MSAWAAKRFWREVSCRAGAHGTGYEVLLDDKVLKTPGKRALVLPNEGLAIAVADEWARVDGLIRPEAMPLTRLANSAAEKVAPLMQAVRDEVLRYGETDMLCYRAESPAELVARQGAVWDPLLDFARQRFGARLQVTQGVVAIAQNPTALLALARAIEGLDAFALTALYDLTALSGSLVIALAAASGADAGDLWQAAQLDFDYQSQLWGLDEEAAASVSRKAADFREAQRFFLLTGATFPDRQA